MTSRWGKLLPAAALGGGAAGGGLVSCTGTPSIHMPAAPVKAEELSWMNYVAQAGIITREVELTTPFYITLTDPTPTTGVYADQFVPLEDPYPEKLQKNDVVAIVGSIGGYYQVIVPRQDTPFLEGTVSKSAVSTGLGTLPKLTRERSWMLPYFMSTQEDLPWGP